MAKSTKVRVELGAAVADVAGEGTRYVLVYAILVDGAYQGVFSSVVHHGRGPTLDDRLFALPPPDGYRGPWDATAFGEGAASFYRQTFGQFQKLVSESAPGARVADILATDRWAFDFEVANR